MYLLLKGGLENFKTSLEDYLTRKSQLLKALPEGSILWGVNVNSVLLKRGNKAFLYVSKSNNFEGGIVLEGEILSVGELKQPYWKSGNWNKYVAMKVIIIPLKGLDETKWKYITLGRMKELGIKPLPGIQKISDDLGKKIEEELKRLL